jgi:excisionase family DNA binding protein
MGKRESQQVAYAVVELQDARDELAASGQDVRAALQHIEDAVERLDGLTSVSPGLPVAEAARYLGVSEPTVREWLKRGVLGTVPGAKPVLVERDGLRRVHRAVDELRERGQDADWLRALLDYLDDAAVLRSPAVQQGLAEMAAGHLEPA